MGSGYFFNHGMKWRCILGVCTMLFFAAAAVRAAEGRTVTAVLDFQVNSPEEAWRNLGVGLSDILPSVLNEHPDIITVDRSTLQAVLREQELSAVGHIDPESAVRMGNIVGVDVFLTGAVSGSGNRMQLFLRVFDARTGEVTRAREIAVSRVDMDSLLKLAAEHGAALISDGEGDIALEGAERYHWEAVLHWAGGVASEDDGHHDAALRLYSEALAADPVYARRKSRFQYGRYAQWVRMEKLVTERGGEPPLLIGTGITGKSIYCPKTLEKKGESRASPWIAHGKIVHEGGDRWTHRRLLPPLDEECENWTLSITDPDTGERLYHGALPEPPDGYEYFLPSGQYSRERMPQNNIWYADLTGSGIKDMILVVRKKTMPLHLRRIIAWEMTLDGPVRELWWGTIRATYTSSYVRVPRLRVFETVDVTGDGVEDLLALPGRHVTMIEGATGEILWSVPDVRWSHANRIALRRGQERTEVYMAINRNRERGSEAGELRVLCALSGETLSHRLGLWNVLDMTFASFFGEPDDTLVISKRERETNSIELVDPLTGLAWERLDGLPPSEPSLQRIFAHDVTQDGTVEIIKTYQEQTYMFYTQTALPLSPEEERQISLSVTARRDERLIGMDAHLRRSLISEFGRDPGVSIVDNAMIDGMVADGFLRPDTAADSRLMGRMGRYLRAGRLLLVKISRQNGAVELQAKLVNAADGTVNESPVFSGGSSELDRLAAETAKWSLEHMPQVQAAARTPAAEEPAADGEKIHVAVAPFQVRRDTYDDPAAGRLLADVFTLGLRGTEGVHLVERRRIEAALAEADLAEMRLSRHDSLRRAGSMLGASAVLTGSFFQTEQYTRLDASVIDTETGIVRAAAGAGSEGAALEDLAQEVMAELSDKLGDSRHAFVKTKSDLVLSEYGRLARWQEMRGREKTPEEDGISDAAPTEPGGRQEFISSQSLRISWYRKDGRWRTGAGINPDSPRPVTIPAGVDWLIRLTSDPGDVDWITLGTELANMHNFGLTMRQPDVERTNLNFPRGFGNMKSIDLSSISLNAGNIANLVRSSPRLQALDASRAMIERRAYSYLGNLKRLRRLDLSYTTLTGEDMAFLERLGELEELNLSHTQIDNDGLAYLRGMHRLEELYLNGTAIGDSGMAHIAGLRGLRVLHLSGAILTSEHLSGPTLTSEGMAQLAKLRNLQNLSLAGVEISGGDMRYLRNMLDLRVLNVSGARAFDDDLTHIVDMQNLTELNLSETLIGDEGLATLKQLEGLRVLSLSSTRVGDKGLVHLRGMFRLHTLHLDFLSITDDGLAQFRGYLPNLRQLSVLGTGVTEDSIARMSGKGQSRSQLNVRR